MTIGLTVQKLLAFTFSIGNALKVPKIGVLGDFRGENCNIYLSNPQRVTSWAENTRFEVLLAQIGLQL